MTGELGLRVSDEFSRKFRKDQHGEWDGLWLRAQLWPFITYMRRICEGS
jgi:hypothetical protein